jgi:hypothetical protein
LNVIRRHLESGHLHVVAGAPEFRYPAYAVYSETADAKIVTPALAGLRHVAGLGPQRRRRANASQASGSTRP